MKKQWRSTTGSTITVGVLGFDITTTLSDIRPSSYLRIANEMIEGSGNELYDLITNGSVITNNGLVDLNPDDSIRDLTNLVTLQIKKDDSYIDIATTILNFSGAGLSATDNSNGKVTISSTGSAVGALKTFPFVSTGNTADKWLGYANSAAPSNEIPLISPQNMEIKGITFSNRDNNVDTNINLFVNGVLQDTWEIRNKRYAWYTGIPSPVTLNIGDRLSVYIERYTQGNGDSTPQDPIVVVIGKILSEQASDSGQQNGD